MNKLPKEVLDKYFDSLNLDFLSHEEKESYLVKLEDLFMKFFTLQLAESLTDEQLEAFNQLDSEDSQFNFFQENGIDYQAIAISVSSQLNSVIREQMAYLKGQTDNLS